MSKNIKYVMFILLFFISCKESNKTYTVKDKFNNKHKYDRPPDKDSMKVYCQVHYEWESIRYYYTEEGITYWMQTLKYFN